MSSIWKQTKKYEDNKRLTDVVAVEEVVVIAVDVAVDVVVVVVCPIERQCFGRAELGLYEVDDPSNPK